MGRGPYCVGAKFVLLVTPPPSPSADVTETLLDRVCVEVLETLMFTESSAMKVIVISQPPGSTLPSTLFMKVYDRRFLDERHGWRPEHRWNPRKEAEAVKLGLLRKMQPEDF
jgi:hypothetical protein